MVKQSLEKRLTRKQTQSKSLTSPEISIPPHPFLGIGTSQGFWQLNWLHLTEQKHHQDGTNKNETEVYGRDRP
jgi:hypothetical protein